MKKLSVLMFFAFTVSSNEFSYNDWLEKEIKAFSNQEIIFEKKSGPWDLDKVILRVRPLVGIEIPLLASFEIKPFVEFYWESKDH